MNYQKKQQQVDRQLRLKKNPQQIKNERITRRMKKIIKQNEIAFCKNQQDKCAICLNQCSKSSTILPCSHGFCMGCIANWWITHSTCPYCRQKFQWIYDYKGRKLTKDQLPANLIIQKQDTLKCQACWADISEQALRICYECRSVYIHRRCLSIQEYKMKNWKCEQCYNAEQLQIQKNIQKEENKIENYTCYFKHQKNLIHRQSQRIISQHQKNCGKQ